MNQFSEILHAVTRFDLEELHTPGLASQLSAIDNWPAFLSELELNGLAPLLLHHCVSHNFSLEQARLLALKALALRHRAAAAARYKCYAELSGAFADRGIPVIALKGLALAPMLYEEDSLRPMRDIDILVATGHLSAGAEILRDNGFDLPEKQDTRFMRDSHQLPNATKEVDGFTISVELHHDALGREFFEHLRYEDMADDLQQIRWQSIQFQTLDHELMLHQLCKHLQGLHPGDLIKLINVLDIVGYAEKFQSKIDWRHLSNRFSHVLNTLRCLHLIVPLSPELGERVGKLTDESVTGVGEPMMAMRRIFKGQFTLQEKLKKLFNPSDWWLYLYYNKAPASSLFWVKTIRHPATIAGWLLRRSYAGLFGKEL